MRTVTFGRVRTALRREETLAVGHVNPYFIVLESVSALIGSITRSYVKRRKGDLAGTRTSSVVAGPLQEGLWQIEPPHVRFRPLNASLCTRVDRRSLLIRSGVWELNREMLAASHRTF